MNFIKKLFGKEDVQLGNEGFWAWFVQNESAFFQILKLRDSILVNDRFIRKLMPKLQALNPRFYCEAGMSDDSTAELVVTAEGDIKSIVWAEELVAAAPKMASWKFTALKPALRSGSIHLNGHSFDNSNIHFFCEQDATYPDEIDLILVHADFAEENKKTITHGTLLYLDSLLGELDAATLIDRVTVSGTGPGGVQPIPMDKLTDFLAWKEKEFVEKYQGTRHDTEHDSYASLEGSDEQGFPSIAIVNSDLLEWDVKPSHPWMTIIEIDYKKAEGTSRNGMPGSKYLGQLRQWENELTRELPDSAGYLTLGWQTYKGKRIIYMACKEFRVASKTIAAWIQKYQRVMTCSYEMYKDKYWRTMEKFR
jgi:hypothetical protein